MRSHLSSDVRSVTGDLIRLRRDIHRRPELGFQEKRTSKLILDSLRRSNVSAKRIVGTGVIGLVKGARSGKTVLMRADMDGLPLREENSIPYRSRNPGAMHA